MVTNHYSSCYEHAGLGFRGLRIRIDTGPFAGLEAILRVTPDDDEDWLRCSRCRDVGSHCQIERLPRRVGHPLTARATGAQGGGLEPPGLR